MMCRITTSSNISHWTRRHLLRLYRCRLAQRVAARPEAVRLCVQPVQPVPDGGARNHPLQPTQPVAQDRRPTLPVVARTEGLLRLLPRRAGHPSQRGLSLPARPKNTRKRRGHNEVRIHAKHAGATPQTARRIPRLAVVT